MARGSILLSFLSFTLLCLVRVRCNVPVMLWESSSVSDKEDLVPALFQLDSDEFSNHIVKKIHEHKPLVVLFLEESLSVEDFSWKDDRGQGSFPQLANLTQMAAKTEFITSVYDPLAALKELAESHDYDWVKYDGSKTPVKSRAVLEVRLRDPLSEEDRPELLREHDADIAEIYSQLLSQYSHIVAVLTGKYSSWVEPEYNRVKRESEDESEASHPFNLTAQFPDNIYSMIVSQNPVFLTDEENNKLNLSLISIQTDRKKGQVSLIGKFQSGIILKFTFTQGDGYWKLGNVTLNNTVALKPSVEILAPIGTSFRHEGLVEFSSPASTVSFSGIQVQAFSNTKMFGDNPPVYFTYPILMGIFVTAILGMILSWAIIMMMDIRTMDRFDDPKGKTITVTQGE